MVQAKVRGGYLEDINFASLGKYIPLLIYNSQKGNVAENSWAYVRSV